MGKKKQQQVINEQPEIQQEQQEQSIQSQEDEDAALLTSKVEEKLLLTLAKLKFKDPSIYDKSKLNIYEDGDFSEVEEEQENKQIADEKSKYTYKKMLKEAPVYSDEEDNGNLPLAVEEKRAKQSFKKALHQNIQKMEDENDDLFKVVKKVGKNEQVEPMGEKEKIKDLTKTFDKSSKKLIKKLLKSEELDETDLFLKNYILDKKWITSKHKPQQDAQIEVIDREDEQRSQQMDQYQAQYNFRFQQPGGTSITQYPRNIEHSLRQKPQTRKQKRKRTQQKKKEEEQRLHKQADERKQQIKKQIIQKLVPEQQVDHDWFFCDDCSKPFEAGQLTWRCQECEDFMLCEQCNDLIIHKHPLVKDKIQEGLSAPKECTAVLSQLKSCQSCRRKIAPNKERYEFTDRSYFVNTMCLHCYDESDLSIKKKYKKVQAVEPNYEALLDLDPQKIKQLSNLKEIEEMVDEYIKTDFEGVLSGGLKTKFRYIDVPKEDFGLSDYQILFGDDKELNKYVSIKKLAPYQDEKMKLRNSVFNKKIKGIIESARKNKNIVKKGVDQIKRLRMSSKMRERAQKLKMRREKRLKITNLSTKEKERNHFVSNSRLESYGIIKEQNYRK